MTHHSIAAHTLGLPAQLWLASKSPRRLELVRTLGVQPTVFLAQQGDAAEALEAPLPGEQALPYVQRVTQLKLHTACTALQHALQRGDLPTLIDPHTPADLVLASDTTVALQGRILGKPADAAEARAMLQALSGQVHQVHTGVAVGVLHPQGPTVLQAIHTAQVQFAPLPAAFIEAYIASGEPFDKAGAYGIQGIAGQFVAHIQGSHSGIMGLPLFETANLLRQACSNAT